LSPLQNETYNSNVPLTVNITTYGNGIVPEDLLQLRYTLDEKLDVIMPLILPYVLEANTPFFMSDELMGLNNGQHILRVHGATDWGHNFSSTVTFMVNATNPNINYKMPLISIINPENETYITDRFSGITLNFSVSEQFLWARYSVNNDANRTTLSNIEGIFSGALKEGANNITVYAVDANGEVGSDTVSFSMVFSSRRDPTPSPITPVVGVTSPQSRLYNQNKIPLNLVINNPIPLGGAWAIYPNVTWIGFSLDGQSNQTIHANTTLTGLTNGVHNVSAYAKDIYGNEGASQTIIFSTETISTKTLPTPIIVAFIGVTVVLIVCFMTYFVRQRKFN